MAAVAVGLRLGARSGRGMAEARLVNAIARIPRGIRQTRWRTDTRKFVTRVTGVALKIGVASAPVATCCEISGSAIVATRRRTDIHETWGRAIAPMAMPADRNCTSWRRRAQIARSPESGRSDAQALGRDVDAVAGRCDRVEWAACNSVGRSVNSNHA